MSGYSAHKHLSQPIDLGDIPGDAAGANQKGGEIITLLQSPDDGLPKILSSLATLDLATADESTLTAARDNIVALLNAIKSYSDTEVLDLLASAARIEGYTDNVESKQAEILAAVNLAKSEATAAKNFADKIDDSTYGLEPLRVWLNAWLSENLWSNGTYGAVGARNEATYGRVPIRQRIDAIWDNTSPRLTSLQDILNTVNGNTSNIGMSLAADRNGSTAAFSLPAGRYLIESVYTWEVIVSPTSQRSTFLIPGAPNNYTYTTTGSIDPWGQSVWGIYKIG